MARKLVVANPAAYEPYVATTLNNLGNLYRDTQRMGEAENVLSEPLTLRTKLFEKNPAVHGIDLVHVNLSLGIVKLRLGKTGEACALAQVVRELGVNPFPDWAAELERACLDR
jgi:hypothetical protein